MRFLKNCRLSVRKGERPEAIILYLGLLSKEETSARLWNEGLLSLPGSEYSQSFYLPFSWLRFSSAEMIGVQSIPGCHGFLTLLSVFVSVSRPLPPPPRAPPRRKKLNL